MTTVIDFHFGNYTLTTAVTNPRPRKCTCGKRLEVGEAVSLIPAGPYRLTRAPRLCLPCALNQVRALALPTFRRLTSKEYPHFVEVEFGEGPVTKAEVLTTFETEYLRTHAQGEAQ